VNEEKLRSVSAYLYVTRPTKSKMSITSRNETPTSTNTVRSIYTHYITYHQQQQQQQQS